MLLSTVHTSIQFFFILCFFAFDFFFFEVFWFFLSFSDEMSSFYLFPDGLMSGLVCSPFSRFIASRSFWFSIFNFSFSSHNSSTSWSRMRKAFCQSLVHNFIRVDI